jgi:CHAP domain
MMSILTRSARPDRVRTAPSRRAFRPYLDGLESRQVLSTAAAVPTVIVQAVADLNSQVVSFAQSHLHQKVGGGECAHLANEALRVAGADFVGHDPGKGDYTWGTLVTTITPGRDSSTAASRPGDIIQFQNVKTSGGWTADHHTAIVAAVDSHGRPTQVYEQNVGVNGKGAGTHDRTERLDPIVLNSKTITAGTIHIYRPTRRVDSPGKVQFSVVNDTSSSQTVTLFFNGKASGTFTLDLINTAGSYTNRSVSSPGSATWTIGINGKAISLANAGVYELFTSGGKTSIRAI